jgi:hypothetical protein
MTGSTSASDEGKRERLMTVAHVRAHNEQAEIMFVESARIYRLLPDNPMYDDALRTLRAAAGTGRRVRVRIDKPNGEIIRRVD